MSNPEAERAATRVFDLLNGYEVGQAEGALETALSKYPSHPSVRAAEALFLLHSGRVLKAKRKADLLAQENITDGNVVNALVHVLQQCCCWESLIKTYERIKHLQKPQQITENIIQTYVRMGAYNKAQSAAMQAFREYADPKYQVWAVQACLAQVPADATEHLQLTMATRLLDSAVLTEKGKMTFSTTRTYVDVLVQQQKYEEAVQFLCSERGSKVGLLETRLEVLAGILQKQNKSRCANAVAKLLWKKNSDNWAPFRIYMDTVEKADAEGDACNSLVLESPTEELRATVDPSAADTSLVAALALAKELQEAERRDRPKKLRRGPFMAELALLQKKGDEDALRKAVQEYVKIFFNKPCCFLDISTFLDKHSAEAIYEWSKEESVAGGEGTKTEEVLRRHTKRILGLRAHVSQWGVDASSIPADEELEKLLTLCQDSYQSARPLSTELAWSEEGLCDGYISVGLNIVMHAYVARKNDLSWIARGLELLGNVDRKLNNPSWLIYSVCFCSLLHLSDSVAIRQLAFKDVQHDTMSHVGLWTFRNGVDIGDISVWTKNAYTYYGRLEKDVSLLRAKVFTFMSWPAMQDIQRFEFRQNHSLAKALHIPQYVLSLIPTCQTQRNVMELTDKYSEELYEAWKTFSSGELREALIDNSDWSVCKSQVLGDIHSPKVQTLTEALVNVPSVEARKQWGRRLLSSLLLLHDVAALERERQRQQSKPKKAAGKKKKTTKEEEEANAHEEAPVTLYTAQEGERDKLEFSPTFEPLANSLLLFVLSRGETPAVDTTQSFAAALQTLRDDRVSFEKFLLDEMYIIVALLQVAAVQKSPVVAWASSLAELIAAAQQHYEESETSADKCWCPAAIPLDGPAGKALRAEKQKKILAALSELNMGVIAITRRK